MERFVDILPRSEQEKLFIAGATVAEPCGDLVPWRQYRFVTVLGAVVATGTWSGHPLNQWRLEFLEPVSNVDT